VKVKPALCPRVGQLLAFYFVFWVLSKVGIARIGVGGKELGRLLLVIDFAVVMAAGQAFHVPLPVRRLLHGSLGRVLADRAGNKRAYRDHSEDQWIEPIDHARQFTRLQQMYDISPTRSR